MATQLETIAQLDKMIHEPARLAIMMLLAVVDQADFLYIQKQTMLTKGNLSSHLSKLEEANYVQILKTIVGKTTQTMCSLTPTGRTAFEAYRHHINTVFNQPPLKPSK